MVFQRPDRGDQNDGARIQTSFDTLDIEEFFCTQVKTETSLRDDKIWKRKSHLRCQYGIRSLSNIGKRTSMNDGGISFDGLHQIGFDRVFQ